MPILGSHPTLATPPSPDEMQGQRSKNGQRGLDSPKDESIVEMLDCDQCEPGEDVVMGTPSSAEEVQGRGSDSPKGESNVEGLDCDQCNPGEDVVMGLDSPKGESNVEGLDCDQCEPGEDVAMDDDNRERQTAVNHSDDESVCNYQSPVVDMTPKRPIDEEIGVLSAGDWKIGGCAAAPDYITAYADADVRDSITTHADADVPDSITDHTDVEVPRLWSRPPLRIKMMDQSSSKLILAEDIVMAEFQLCKRPRMNDSLEREYVTSNLPRDPRTPIGSGWAWPDNAETNGKPRPSMMTTAGRKPRKSKKNTSFKTNAVKKAVTGKGKGKSEKQKGGPKRVPKSLRPFYSEKEDEKDVAERDAATETTPEA
ncbi:hypothetical protein B0H14DRAFT_3873205 [Mycena olivaceomarginata]|nr:hypothetical protein B0H14DRAFT_3873205 [Mycena olivaceomarginata]